MPMKLSIGLSRKIGLLDYGSLGATCHLELELDSALLSRDPVSLGDRARQAYSACAEAIEDALKRHRPADPRPCSNDRAQASSQRHFAHRYVALPATAKQLEFARQLATQISSLDEPGLTAFTQEHWGKSPANLDRSEASQLIDELRQLLHAQNGIREMSQVASRRDTDDWRTNTIDEPDDRHDSANGSPNCPPDG